DIVPFADSTGKGSKQVVVTRPTSTSPPPASKPDHQPRSRSPKRSVRDGEETVVLKNGRPTTKSKRIERNNSPSDVNSSADEEEEEICRIPTRQRNTSSSNAQQVTSTPTLPSRQSGSSQRVLAGDHHLAARNRNYNYSSYISTTKNTNDPSSSCFPRKKTSTNSTITPTTSLFQHKAIKKAAPAQPSSSGHDHDARSSSSEIERPPSAFCKLNFHFLRTPPNLRGWWHSRRKYLFTGDRKSNFFRDRDRQPDNNNVQREGRMIRRHDDAPSPSPRSRSFHRSDERVHASRPLPGSTSARNLDIER
ncbi:unnamed protein product, partial [Amoebophrya sp. A25]